MAQASPLELLVPHTLRVLGHASPRLIAALRSLDPVVVESQLEDERALGLVTRSQVGATTTWHLTDHGRTKGEADLAAELDRSGGRQTVKEAHATFLVLNRRLGPVMTQWQLQPTPTDQLAANAHRDAAYDDAVIRRLARLGRDLRSVTDRLSSVLERFDLHQPRIDAALRRIQSGEDSWVDSPEVPSMNIVWIQLHEDLLATLGIARGEDDPGS